MSELVCQAINAAEKFKNLGNVRQNTTTPGIGEAAIAVPTIKLANLALPGPDGVDVTANWAQISGGDVLVFQTPSGDLRVTVTSNDGVSGGGTDLTVSQDSATGTIEDGEVTGVWLLLP